MAGLTAAASARVERFVDAARERTSTPPRRTRTTVVLGRALGVLVAVCFLTGLYSHLLQNPVGWLPLFPRPVWLYQVTQGTHVLAGLVMVPVLLGKLWAVYPRLFTWPPVTGPVAVLERGSIALLVGSALVEVAIGVMNIAQWYAFDFSFRRVHFVLAWVLVGSVILHIAVKLPLIIAFWRPVPADPAATEQPPARTWPEHPDPDPDRRPTEAEAISRRGALIAVAASAGAILLGTAGQTVAPLASLAVLSPRRPGIGPQGLPVNRTAAEAGVRQRDVDDDWTIRIAGATSALALSRSELAALPQTTADLPIACVEGWSQTATWTGVPLREVLELAGGTAGAGVRVTSLQVRGAFSRTVMPQVYVDDPLTLIALKLGGEELDIDHGYPARIIAPGRPGVMQTKWLSSIEVLR
ncbi:molybdopterin-dependent oxidoreductase [Microbacterium aquimaris]|uniref:Molybdopterin-dependent oxidoreductase n=1 Tax=Microbacterium aquimaris TaxID=459816 RepID=A0ABU5N8A0_9MICO|nr:molybdopterin-dependent oxidoreductase [Microbacterium aquimaris]MDZ8162272.1 molybdopterin-dependent oxidoreductase [Microbacterium aquimaris]